MNTTLFLITVCVNIYFNCWLFLQVYRIRKFPNLKQYSGSSFRDQVTVVITARNEAANIIECIRQYSEWPVVACIIVVDDHSSDNTFELALQQTHDDQKVSVYHAPPLPRCWTGKNHGLHHGAQLVDTRYIFFTDADVKIKVGSLELAVKKMEASGADHLSGHFKILCRSISDSICAPVMAVSSSVSLFGPSGMQGAAMGAFNLISADFYRYIGGHESIKDSIVDDVALARLVKQKGGRSVFLDLSDYVSVRLFSGFSGFWKAVARSSQAYLGPKMALGILGGIGVAGLAIGTISNLIMPLYLWDRSYLNLGQFVVCVSLAAAVYLLGVLCAYGSRRFYGSSSYWSLLYPLPMAMLGAASAVSGMMKLFNCKVLWRGRYYEIK